MDQYLLLQQINNQMQENFYLNNPASILELQLLFHQDQDKQKLYKEHAAKLNSDLDGDLTQKEMDAIIDRHNKELDQALEKFNDNKQRQMAALREQLTQRRRQREAELKKRHKQEASAVLQCVFLLDKILETALANYVVPCLGKNVL